MAGEWIKWTKGLAKRPEVLHMAHLMGRSRHEVAGILCEFWEWADENVVPENESASCPGFVRIPSATPALVDALAGAGGFANALSAVGWIVIRDGALEFPKFGRHNGKSAKRRALDAERKQKSRGESPDSVPKKSASKADKKRTRGEERREEKEEKKEESATQTADAAHPPPKPNSTRKEPTGPHHESIRAFCAAWEAKYGDKYPFAKGKDGDAAKWILEKCGGSVEKFTAVANRYLADDDPFYKGHTLAMLRSTLPKWLTDAPPTANGKPFSQRPARETPEEIIARLSREHHESKQREGIEA